MGRPALTAAQIIIYFDLISSSVEGLIMSSSEATNVTGFNKSKEDFIWFIKRAMKDKKSGSYAELYHCLIKMFVDADTNKDGLVSRGSFSKLIDMAASIPRMYGYAPTDAELYKTEEEKEQARQKMFDSMDLKATGVITVDEWLKLCMEHIIVKTATLAAHPILDHGNLEAFKAFLKAALVVGTPENTELYWFLLELFTDADPDKDGIVMLSDFSAMLDRALEAPKKLGMSHPDKGLLETDDAKRKECHHTIFKTYNPVGDDKMCFDEWIKLAMEGVFKKM